MPREVRILCEFHCGYTNAGKSTLLNTLTNAAVLEEDKLFATLDPTTRNYKPDGQEILLTIQLIYQKTSHHLIDAFRSTLEEAKYADIIIHMVDASNVYGKSYSLCMRLWLILEFRIRLSLLYLISRISLRRSLF